MLPMDWKTVASQWKNLKGQFKSKFERLTNDDLTAIAGRKDFLITKVQEVYGITDDEAERRVNECLHTITEGGNAVKGEASSENVGHEKVA